MTADHHRSEKRFIERREFGIRRHALFPRPLRQTVECEHRNLRRRINQRHGNLAPAATLLAPPKLTLLYITDRSLDLLVAVVERDVQPIDFFPGMRFCQVFIRDRVCSFFE